MANEFDILFEDQDVVVINKPPEVVVNRAGTVAERTVQDWFIETYLQHQSQNQPSLQDPHQYESWQQLVPADFDSQYGAPAVVFAQRQGMVHRLDKDTSGALVFAKNPGSLVALLAAFRHRQVQKRYLCLVHGKFRVPAGTIQAPVERARFDRQRFAVSATGRPAATDYEVINFYSGITADRMATLFNKDSRKQLSLYQGFSLVNCWPKTGRTHQIRVHLQHWHHPLVGDSKYVGKKRAKLDALWAPRQFLHADQLEFVHPRTREMVRVTAPLPEDLAIVLDSLQLA